ncbi:hypothetical protein [Acidithrix ferrooxidans]|uniref:Uncharacterized protein n=1 Tax=Acidithrix ferrooxidans TaxID=1280514 RepID=A0A0D8HM70_9ACTN|nr:hypothetical protein [Acidithrix ferrooxidans]KJF18181.1 hypothetical protein AXFE_09260 [Acidithrix ferrooxidans]
MVRLIETSVLAFMAPMATLAIVIAINDVSERWQKHHRARYHRLVDAAFREQLEQEARMHEVAAVLRYKAHEARKAMIREAHRASQLSNDAES